MEITVQMEVLMLVVMEVMDLLLIMLILVVEVVVVRLLLQTTSLNSGLVLVEVEVAMLRFHRCNTLEELVVLEEELSTLQPTLLVMVEV